MRATPDTGSATAREGALGPWAATQGALPVATCTAAGKPEHRAQGLPGADTLRAQTDWTDAGTPRTGQGVMRRERGKPECWAVPTWPASVGKKGRTRDRGWEPLTDNHPYPLLRAP